MFQRRSGAWHHRALHIGLLSWMLSVAFLFVTGASPHANAVTTLQQHGALQRDGTVGIISHRGAAALAPENTLAAVRLAAAHGVDFIEVDLRLTRDRHAILMHDETLDRTTTGRGHVQTRTLEAIRRHDAGSWFHSSFRGERVPTLEEFADEIAVTGTRAFIELKDVWRAEDVQAVVDELREHHLLNQTVLLSFEPETLQHLADLAPEFARFMLTRELNEQTLETAVALHVSGIGAREQLLAEAPDITHAARNLGIGIAAYTLNSESKWQLARDLGVDLIVTDDPIALAAWQIDID